MEIGNWRWEIGNRKSDIANGNLQIGNAKFEIGNGKFQFWAWGAGLLRLGEPAPATGGTCLGTAVYRGIKTLSKNPSR